MPSHRARALVSSLALAAALSVGCEPTTALHWAGVRSLREVPPAEAFTLAEDGGRLVQRWASDERLPPLPGAQRLRPDDPVPPEWTLGPGWTVVVAGDPSAALRLGARLSREGVPRVAVVAGDPLEIEALGQVTTAAAHPELETSGEVQPDPENRHPTD